MIDLLLESIEKNTSAKVAVNEPLRKHTTYGIGGPAEIIEIADTFTEWIINDVKPKSTNNGTDLPF